MTRKNIILIGLITIILIAMIPSAIAADNSNWTTKNVGGIDFKIPPEFDGGELKESSYSLTNVFEFGLLTLEDDKNLRRNYGYESTNEEVYDVKEMNINGHNAVAYFSNRSIVEHPVTYIFFETNGTVYALSYNGDDVNKTIKEIVSSSPKSKWSENEFNEKLNQAQQDYIEEQEEFEREYQYEEAYRQGYYQGQSDSRHSGRDIFGYYFFYKLGQRNSR